jgi:hypothetical protein
MVNYNCPRCGFNTNIKTKYTSHLSRKYICKSVIGNNNLQSEYIKYNIADKICYFNDTAEIPQKTAKTKKTTAEIPQKTAEIKKISVKYSKKNGKVKKMARCKFCDKEFIRKDSLPRHLKTCKEKLKDEEEKGNLLNLIELLNKQLEEQRESLNKQLEQQNKEKEEYKKQIEEQNIQIRELIKKTGVNIGNQYNNNIQNNIQILAYNNTDISHLTDKDYMKCLKHANFCIPHLIEKIHFNPKKPENHNIYISNLKNNYVMIYNGSKWMINDRDESIQNLIDDKESIIEQKLEEWLENGEKYPEIMNKFNRYLEKRENDKVLDKIKGEIKLMLFNNRDLIK